MTPDQKTLFVACSMLKDEVMLALRQTGAAPLTRWVAVMHDRPVQMQEVCSSKVPD